MRRNLRRSIGTLGLAAVMLAACGDDQDNAAAPADGGRDAAGGSGATGGNAGSGATAGGTAGAAGGGGGTTGGSAGSAGTGGGGTGGSGGSGGGPQATSNKMDLLVVVDNSISMEDKQDVLERSVTEVVSRLVNPRCIDATGAYPETQPTTPTAPCPTGSTRELTPVDDMHVGVISTSLGGHGADICSPADGTFNSTQDDRGHLLTRDALGGTVETWENRGFLVWDPEQRRTPAGLDQPGALAGELGRLVRGAGQLGCGFESTLEAWYRFLIDPEPYQAVRRENNVAIVEGVDQVLLAQRAAFLRPDSSVVIIVLSDENDCSVIDGGVGWLVGQSLSPQGGVFRMPRATAACASDPNSDCCRSCSLVESTPPVGCGTLASDAECAKGPYTAAEDSLNLRCFDQKRRFGFDLLQPLDRYVRGLNSPTVPNRASVQVENPLFSDLSGGTAPPRSPSLVTLVGIVGVPWQDLAQNPTDATALSYLSASALTALGRWAVVAGNSATGALPTDPFARESIDPRTGSNPVTGDPIQPPTASSATASPINGHEYLIPRRDDLQYACTFALPSPRDCSVDPQGCECPADAIAMNKPLCQNPTSGQYGTTQYFAKAFPGTRHLELLSRLGSQAVAASICPRNVTDATRADYAYRPAVQAMIERLRVTVQ